jgi:serine/threonine protein kinase
MHRDIKGSNILVNDEGIVKLADFGASKKLENLQANVMMNLTVRGTPYFMAPEVFEEKYSAKADIWGVGCVAFQMITTVPPWKDKEFTNPISLFNHIKNHDGPPPMDIPNDLLISNGDRKAGELFESLVRKCFQKDPSSRPTTDELLVDPFFIEMHDGADQETSPYRALFSPGNETTTSRETMNTGSPATPACASDTPSPQRFPSPSPQNHSRSKSVIQWKTSFMSPPRPKRNKEKSSPSPIPMHQSPQATSPQPDTSEWPDWARAQLNKKKLFTKSPASRQTDPDLSDVMGSLALSADSASRSQNPFRRASQGRTSTVGSTANTSNLIGLELLDNSRLTYEL